LNLAQRQCNPRVKSARGDELGTDDADDDFEPSCDDIRLAWLAQESGAEHKRCHDFEALCSDR
jgi:hypothetical protein